MDVEVDVGVGVDAAVDGTLAGALVPAVAVDVGVAEAVPLEELVLAGLAVGAAFALEADVVVGAPLAVWPVPAADDVTGVVPVAGLLVAAAGVELAALVVELLAPAAALGVSDVALTAPLAVVDCPPQPVNVAKAT